MTYTIDKFLIQHGFEETEVTRVKYRGFLYLAISGLGLMTLTFSILAINAWF